jgi:hypothetical protein
MDVVRCRRGCFRSKVPCPCPVWPASSGILTGCVYQDAAGEPELEASESVVADRLSFGTAGAATSGAQFA